MLPLTSDPTPQKKPNTQAMNNVGMNNVYFVQSQNKINLHGHYKHAKHRQISLKYLVVRRKSFSTANLYGLNNSLMYM